jgi:Cys-tRNA(Pro) deacylase
MMRKEQFTTEHVRAALEQYGLSAHILTYDASTATAPQAAEAIGTELGSIVKSLCFIVGEQPLLVLTAGDQRVDERKLGALYGVGRKKVKIADASVATSYTGYAPGGVPPVGLRARLPILIDATLGRYEIVYAAAGSPNSLFPITFDALVDITNGHVVDVVKTALPDL